jgi:type II secretory pathway component PulK
MRSGPSACWDRFKGAAARPARPGNRQGSVLIIVLWIAFGLVSVALYFAHAMSFERRAAENRVARVEAEQAIAGAARYASNLLVNLEVPGMVPDPLTYECEAVPVGDATFWLVGRDTRPSVLNRPMFGLIDESSKLNLNTATLEMLQLLPRMTPELAAAIIDWRDTDDEASTGGAESQVYQRLNPPYRCKNGNFESVDELRLVYGVTLEILRGEDANLNGILDANEDDGDLSPPPDNRNGRLDPGLVEYVTVYSRDPNTRTNGSPRINLGGTNQQELATLFQEKFGTDRANELLRQVGGPGGGVRSVLEFFVRSGMTAEEFEQVEDDVTVSTATPIEGLVNVNTAPEAVLACLPGIGEDLASSLVAYRQSNPAELTSLAWVAQALDLTNAVAAGPYLTARSRQFTADIMALGRHDRGYQREKFVYDVSDGTPRIIFRQELTWLGWGLGSEVRRAQQVARQSRLR